MMTFFVVYGLDVKSNSGNGIHTLFQLEFVKDSSFTSGIEPQHQNALLRRKRRKEVSNCRQQSAHCDEPRNVI